MAANRLLNMKSTKTPAFIMRLLFLLVCRLSINVSTLQYIKKYGKSKNIKTVANISLSNFQLHFSTLFLFLFIALLTFGYSIFCADWKKSRLVFIFASAKNIVSFFAGFICLRAFFFRLQLWSVICLFLFFVCLPKRKMIAKNKL